MGQGDRIRHGSGGLRRVKRLREPRGRVRFLSDAERKALLKACKDETEDTRIYPFVVIAISTGARRGEILQLRWPGVDFERGRAVIHKTKNRERRSIPLSGLAFELLRERSKVRRIDSDLVFASPYPGEGWPRRAWDRAVKESGIEDYRFHDLRHTAASYLAMNGATPSELKAILGHKTSHMVSGYAHLTEQHTSDVVRRMNEKVFGSL